MLPGACRVSCGLLHEADLQEDSKKNYPETGRYEVHGIPGKVRVENRKKSKEHDRVEKILARKYTVFSYARQ